MKKEQKEKIVNEFVEIFSEHGFYLMDFKGLNVAEITDLRSKLRDAKVSMRVVKNTLAKRALKQAGIDNLNSFLVGATSIVWSEEDSITPLRILNQLLKQYDKGTIKAGLIYGLLVKDSDIDKISNLPDKSEFYTKIASSLNSPIVKLVMVFNAVPSKFVRIVDALREKKTREIS